MELKVPFLADRQLESAATELLRKYAKWKGAPPRPPIPVDDIVEGLLGLSLSIGDLRTLLGKNDVLGATWLDDGHVMIDSSLEGNEGRFSFTLAHETGHWVLHRPIIEMEKVTVPLFAREPNAKPGPAIVCRDGQRDSAEIQADRFAAYLLMPATDVRAAARLVSGDPLAIDRLEARRKAQQQSQHSHQEPIPAGRTAGGVSTDTSTIVPPAPEDPNAKNDQSHTTPSKE